MAEWLKIFSRNKQARVETEKVASIEDILKRSHRAFLALDKAFSGLMQQGEVYAENPALAQHFITLIDLYKEVRFTSTETRNRKLTPKERLTERYRRATDFVDDLEQHARNVLKAAGIDSELSDDMRKLAHPKIEDYLDKLGDFSASVHEFLDAFEAAYPEEVIKE